MQQGMLHLLGTHSPFEPHRKLLQLSQACRNRQAAHLGKRPQAVKLPCRYLAAQCCEDA